MADSHATLAESLIEFHKTAPHIPLDAVNPHFQSKHASLPGIWKALREPLTACHLTIVQEPCTLDSGMPGLRTTLLHESGDKMSSEMPLAVEKPGPQALGSAITYARRYALLAVLGLVGDEDDDGNAAQKAAASPTAEVRGTGEAAASSDARVATDPQRKKIAAMANNVQIPISDEQRVNLITECESPDLTRERAHRIIERLTELEKEAVPV